MLSRCFQSTEKQKSGCTDDTSRLEKTTEHYGSERAKKYWK